MLESNQSSCCFFNSNVDNSIIISSSSSSSSSPMCPSTINCKLLVKRKLIGCKRSLEGRKTANARERARMNTLNKAFSRLKSSLPWVPIDTKLSKLDTLRSALRYINYLIQLLNDNQEDHLSSSSFDHNSNFLTTFVDWSNQQLKHFEFNVNQTINDVDQQVVSPAIGYNQDQFTLDYSYIQSWNQNNQIVT